MKNIFFTLLELPYALDALEPVISKQTLEFHHGKHLQAYVDNLNKLIAGTEFEGKSLEEIIVCSSLPAATGNPTAIFNNAGQVLNHEMYFEQFSPLPVRKSPSGDFLEAIKKQWVTLDAFKLEFELAGTTLFGSGWVWLQADADGELSIGKYVGADNPVAHGLKPILTFDVWEHAYYLDYQNRRAEYLHKLWDLLDWNVVQQRYR